MHVRTFFTLAAIAAIVIGLAVLLAFSPHLPSRVPSNISSDGMAHGSIPTWTLFLPLGVEALVCAAILARVGNAGKIRGEAARAAMWLALASGFWLVTRAEWMQMQAALHPGTLHLMWWFDFALIAGIIVGVVITAISSRRPGER